MHVRVNERSEDGSTVTSMLCSPFKSHPLGTGTSVLGEACHYGLNAMENKIAIISLVYLQH